MSEATPPPRLGWMAVVGVTVLALGLRVPRALLRWDEVSVAYAAYADPAARMVEAGDWAALPQAWVGLHPPLHAAVLGIGERWLPIPAVALGFSALCSAAACGLLAARFGLLAGLVLAMSAVSISYAAEINNYPVAALGLAAALAGAHGPALHRNLGVALASWSHVLGLGAAGALSLLAAWRAGGGAAPVLRAAGLIAAPALTGALLRAGEDSTFQQPALDLRGWAAGAVGALSLPGLVQAGLLVVLAGLGAVHRRARHQGAGLVLGVLTLLYAIFVMAGVAAHHQFPYLSLLVVPLAGLAATAQGRGAHALVLVLSVAQVGPALAGDLGRLAAIRADLARSRAVDVALGLARCGDLLWLVAPALQADDDKTDHSAVLWRISPWQAAHRAVEAVGDPVDWRFGHPRWTGGLQLRTSTELAWGPLDAGLSAAAARGADAYIVLYDHAPATGLDQRLRLALRAWPHEERAVGDDLGLGADLLFVIPSAPGMVRTAPAVAGCGGGAP